MIRFIYILITFLLFNGCKGKSQTPEADVNGKDSIVKVDTVKSFPNPIVLEGFYRGKNVYVQNPFNCNGTGFCIYDYTVNGTITADEITSSAFEFDLSKYALKIGDPVEIKIWHYDCCQPKILNPEVLK